MTDWLAEVINLFVQLLLILTACHYWMTREPCKLGLHDWDAQGVDARRCRRCPRREVLHYVRVATKAGPMTRPKWTEARPVNCPHCESFCPTCLRDGITVCAHCHGTIR